MERLRQPVASHGNGFRLSEPFWGASHLPPIATVATAELHKGSILRCLFWLRRSPQRHADATLADAQRVRAEVNALGDAVEDGHLEVGVQLLLGGKS
jgi:hypothetical protein